MSLRGLPHPRSGLASANPATVPAALLKWVYYYSLADGCNSKSHGNTEAAEKRLRAVNGLTLLSSTDSAIDLARHLILKSIVPRKAAEDALHIALATIHGMDYLLTWNCRHIANMEIQRNISHHLESIGLLMPIMCTPEELLGEYDDDITG